MSEELNLQKEDLADEMDRTRSEMEQALKIRLRSREGLFLKKIEAAIARIKDGSFGLCIDCDVKISDRRLEARPTTTLCVSCKEEREVKEKSFIDGGKLKIKKKTSFKIA